MKMMYKYFKSPVDFENKRIKLLIIENRHLYRSTVLDLAEENGSELFVFSENSTPVDFGKKIRFINDVLTFPFADKKLMTKINSDLERSTNTTYYSELCAIRQACLLLCNHLAQDHDFDFEFCDSIEAMSLIKLFSFSPKDDSSNSIERLLRFIKLLNMYMGIKCYIVKNLYSYFSDEELEEFYRNIEALDVNLVILENIAPENISSKVQPVIVDNDLCVMVDNPII